MLADGALFRMLQLIHATVRAGWWQTTDSKPANFRQVAEALLAPLGENAGYFRSYLYKAYDQNNWHDLVEDIDREAVKFKKNRAPPTSVDS